MYLLTKFKAVLMCVIYVYIGVSEFCCSLYELLRNPETRHSSLLAWLYDMLLCRVAAY